MALTRRFTLRPDQLAAIEEKQREKQAELPVEEPLAIETMVPEPGSKPEPEVKPEPVAETTNEVKEEPANNPEPIPEKITEEPVQTTVEESAEESKDTEPEPEKDVETKETADKKAEETSEEPKPTKRTRKATKKTEDEPEIINVTNEFKKNKELTEILASVMPKYIDTAFEEFKEGLEKDLKWTVFDERADAATLRTIISNLTRCFDNVTREYARVNTCLEQLSNKSYGMIPRQIILNSNGANEIGRKQAGVHAPEVYKNGTETINLYALQAALEGEAIYLQMIMKQLDYKRSMLISALTAHKIEGEIIGD